jgi:hypothetical protein
MGIPTFFRSILKGNRRVIQGAKEGVLSVDYFFMDFNSIIYKEWGERTLAPTDASLNFKERWLYTGSLHCICKSLDVHSLLLPIVYLFDGG